MTPLEFQDVAFVGSNPQWQFVVARLDERWIGAAIGEVEGGQFVHIFPEITDDGFALGITDRALCIKQTCACALDPEQAFGGIDQWQIPEAERGTLDDLPMVEDLDGYEDLDDSLHELERPGPGINLGPCCICGDSAEVRTLWHLKFRCPTPGHGWGCVVCSTPCDGAQAVICDTCFDLAEHHADPRSLLQWACRGYPGTEGRVPIADLVEPFDHDVSKHQSGD